MGDETKRDNGGPAFPVPAEYEAQGSIFRGGASEGMTLRDYFAAAALTAIINPQSEAWNGAAAARIAYQLADAMLVARATHPTPETP